MPLLQVVNINQAKAFGKEWTLKGVAIFMDDARFQFATDFANVVISSFIEDQRRRMLEAQKPKIISTEV